VTIGVMLMNPPSKRAETASPLANAPTGPIILVVDDFEDFRFMLRLRLELNNYRVSEAADGREAVEAALRERPDLILMDLSLPVVDGFTATRLIRQQSSLRSVPIIAITADGTATCRVKASAAGCDYLLTKPLDFKDLDVVIKTLLKPKTIN
jgi:two-component system cell cycle response regulator DivK